MVEPIEEMPDGTLGFRARGELTRSDYRETLIPALREAIGRGPVRLLVIVEDEIERLDLGARVEDAKADISFVRRSGALERTALVTDVGWIRRFFQLFRWLAPGELRVFDLAAEDEARAWLAA